MEQKITGAGIIPVLNNTSGKYEDLSKDNLYLILVDNKGMYDFPKGGIDHGEYVFDCALRETEEECSLTKSNFLSFYNNNEDDAFKCGKGLFMFLGFLDSINNLKIKENPVTSYKEHSHFLWLTYDEILDSSKLYDFLIPALKSAHIVINKSQ